MFYGNRTFYDNKRFQITSPKGFLKLGCAFLGIGFLLLLISFFVYRGEENFAKTAKYTTGVVIDFLAENVGNSTGVNGGGINSANAGYEGLNYFPVVRFVLNGHRYVFSSHTGANPPPYQQGQSVSVMYDPHNPLNAEINSVASQWPGAIILVILGAVFAVSGAFLIVFRNKIQSGGSVVRANIQDS